MRILLLVTFLYCMNLPAQTDNEDIQIINFISRREVSGNQLVRTDSLTIQINNRQGDENAQISIPYSKDDKLSIQEAYIQETSGNIIYKIKNKDNDPFSFSFNSHTSLENNNGKLFIHPFSNISISDNPLKKNSRSLPIDLKKTNEI